MSNITWNRELSSLPLFKEKAADVVKIIFNEKVQETMKRCFLSLTFICAILLANGVFAEWTVQKNATGQWLISENGKPVLQYNYETLPLPEGYWEQLQHGQIYAVPRSDYIHPLFDLNGKPITHDWSLDHAHHRGIYWAWPEVGYKGTFGDLHALQGVFARPTGNIGMTTKNGTVSLQGESLWKWNDEESIVHETATITVHPLSATGRIIDLEFRFKGLVDEVTLARRGTDQYGGLNFRMENLSGFQSSAYQEHDGDAAKSGVAWGTATWKDADSGKTMELTVFEKADNPDYPGEYMHYPDIQFFQPTFPKKGTRFVLKKDEILTLQFQLWLHEATADDAAKKTAWKEFQKR